MTKFQVGTMLTCHIMDGQIHSIEKAIRSLFADPVTILIVLTKLVTYYSQNYAGIIGTSVVQYWNFLLANRWPCDNRKYCQVRLMSQCIDIIRVKWDNDVYLKQKLILLLLYPVVLLSLQCTNYSVFLFINYIKVQY